MAEKKRIEFEAYKKKHPGLVVIHAQPDWVEVVDDPKELKVWAKEVLHSIESFFPPIRGVTGGNPDDYPVGGSSPHTHTQTFYSEDGRNKRDHDCEG